MKTLIAMAMLALGGIASAETLNLQTTAGGGNSHDYFNVQTDQPPTTVTIYISEQYGQIELWFGAFTVGGQYFGTYSAGNQMVLTNPYTQQQIVVQLTETYVTVYIGSGRGQHKAKRWTLQSGTVTR